MNTLRFLSLREKQMCKQDSDVLSHQVNFISHLLAIDRFGAQCWLVNWDKLQLI